MRRWMAFLALVICIGAVPAQDTWTRLAPDGGFVSSVAFHPTQTGVIWASGDDSAGIFRSTSNGATWTRFANAPRNHSTYCLAIEAADPLTVYAPNHFGRGLLRTRDGGVTWAVAGTGLPGTSAPQKRIYDVIIHPSTVGTVYAATSAGLFRSTDHGDNFTAVTHATFAGATDFRAAAFVPDGRIFCAVASGAVFAGDTTGTTWISIPTGESISVADIATTANAAYILYDGGTLWKYGFSGPTLTKVNDWVTGTFQSSIQTHLTAVSGASAATDRLYIGTSVVPTASKYGCFRSDDGGATFLRKSIGLGSASLFSIAVDPMNGSHVACGTVGSGLFVSSDAGDTWTPANVGLSASVATSVAVDPANASHLLFSATEAYDGTPGMYETTNGGVSWLEVTAMPVDAFGLDIDPANPSRILAGTWGNNGAGGIYRTTTGRAGPWTPVLAATVSIDRFMRDRVDPQRVYAIATGIKGTATAADYGVYTSANGGASWTHPSGFYTHLAVHPTTTGEAVAIGGDAVATTNAFATAPTSLGLAAAAPSRIFSAVAFDPANPAIVLVGESTGQLWITRNYTSTGVGVTWTSIANPARDVQIRRVIITHAAGGTAWYAACFAADTWITALSTTGVMKSTDDGVTWSWVTNGLESSDYVYDLAPVASNPTHFIAAFWGGGIYQLDIAASATTSGSTSGSGSGTASAGTATAGSGSGGGGSGGCGLGGGFAAVLIGSALMRRSRRSDRVERGSPLRFDPATRRAMCGR